MRYVGSNEITFTNFSGESVVLIEAQELSLDQSFLREIEVRKSDQLDEIAQRPDIYGRDNFDLWYFIFDFNAAAIMDNGFTLTGLKTLRIPVGGA